MIINAIHWSLDPDIFHIGPLTVRYYGLLFAAAFFFGYYFMQKIFKREGLVQEKLDSLTVYTAVGTVLGARLGHCLFYQPEYYLAHPLEILKIWEGGLASHGAAIGILIALYLFARNHHRTYLWVLDRVVIMVALGGFFIRMGNLMNSEIYGVETSLPWGFVFELRGEVVPKHPTQIYEALAYLAIFLFLYWLYQKRATVVKEGTVFGLFLILLFSARFFIEFIKENQVPFEAYLPLNMGQLLSIPFVVVGLIIVVLAQRNKRYMIQPAQAK
jgi:prolipoprotein diacylglyceryl transferase